MRMYCVCMCQPGGDRQLPGPYAMRPVEPLSEGPDTTNSNHRPEIVGTVDELTAPSTSETALHPA